MKNIVKSLVVASFVVSSGVYADDGFYVGLSGGLSKSATIKNADAEIVYRTELYRDSRFLERTTLAFRRGINFRGAIGYQFGDFRVEAEPSYIKSKYKSFHDIDGDAFIAKLSGYTSATSILANGYFDLNFNSVVTPYVGAGVGFSRLNNHIRQSDLVEAPSNNPIPDVVGNIKENKLAYQAVIGAKIDLTNKTAINVDYRYFATQKLKALDKGFRNQSINLGLIYKF